jgi:hypothetical protein
MLTHPTDIRDVFCMLSLILDLGCNEELNSPCPQGVLKQMRCNWYFIFLTHNDFQNLLPFLLHIILLLLKMCLNIFPEIYQ